MISENPLYYAKANESNTFSVETAFGIILDIRPLSIILNETCTTVSGNSNNHNHISIVVKLNGIGVWRIVFDCNNPLTVYELKQILFEMQCYICQKQYHKQTKCTKAWFKNHKILCNMKDNDKIVPLKNKQSYYICIPQSLNGILQLKRNIE